MNTTAFEAFRDIQWIMERYQEIYKDLPLNDFTFRSPRDKLNLETLQKIQIVIAKNYGIECKAK